MRRRRQSSIAALMIMVLGTGLVLALLRDPDIKSVLWGLAIGGLLCAVLAGVTYVCFIPGRGRIHAGFRFAVLAGVTYVCFGCILLIFWLLRSFQPRGW
jgi:multisubunit Na+/H+ antiporter MnhB subunit